MNKSTQPNKSLIAALPSIKKLVIFLTCIPIALTVFTWDLNIPITSPGVDMSITTFKGKKMFSYTLQNELNQIKVADLEKYMTYIGAEIEEDSYSISNSPFQISLLEELIPDCLIVTSGISNPSNTLNLFKKNNFNDNYWLSASIKNSPIYKIALLPDRWFVFIEDGRIFIDRYPESCIRYGLDLSISVTSTQYFIDVNPQKNMIVFSSRNPNSSKYFIGYFNVNPYFVKIQIQFETITYGDYAEMACIEIDDLKGNILAIFDNMGTFSIYCIEHDYQGLELSIFYTLQPLPNIVYIENIPQTNTFIGLTKFPTFSQIVFFDLEPGVKLTQQMIAFTLDNIPTEAYRGRLIIPGIRGIAIFQSNSILVKIGALCFKTADPGSQLRSCKTCDKMFDSGSCLTCFNDDIQYQGTCRLKDDPSIIIESHTEDAVPSPPEDNSGQNQIKSLEMIGVEFFNSNLTMVANFNHPLDEDINENNYYENLKVFSVLNFYEFQLKYTKVDNKQLIIVLKDIFFDLRSDIHLVPQDLSQYYSSEYSDSERSEFTSSSFLLDNTKTLNFSKFPIIFADVDLKRRTNISRISEIISTIIQFLTGGFLISNPKQGSIIIKFLQLIDFLPFIDIEVPSYYAYILEYFDGELSEVFPNFLSTSEKGTQCEMNQVIISQKIECSLLNNIGYFFTILAIYLMIKLSVSFLLMITTNKTVFEWLSPVNNYFSLEYLISLIFTFEIDLLIYVSIFYFQADFKSQFRILEIWISAILSMVIFGNNLIYWGILYCQNSLKEHYFAKAIREPYYSRLNSWKVFINFAAKILREFVIPILLIKFIDTPLIQVCVTMAIMGLALLLKMTHRITVSYIDLTFQFMGQMIYFFIVSVYFMLEVGIININSSLAMRRTETILVFMLFLLFVSIIAYLFISIFKMIVQVFQDVKNRKRMQNKINGMNKFRLSKGRSFKLKQRQRQKVIIQRGKKKLSAKNKQKGLKINSKIPKTTKISQNCQNRAKRVSFFHVNKNIQKQNSNSSPKKTTLQNFIENKIQIRTKRRSIWSKKGISEHLFFKNPTVN